MRVKSLVLAVLLGACSISFAAQPAAKSSGAVDVKTLQTVVGQLQGQIKQVQSSIAPAIQAQAKVTHQEIIQLQQSTQQQLTHLQQEIVQLQKNLMAQIQKLADSNAGK